MDTRSLLTWCTALSLVACRTTSQPNAGVQPPRATTSSAGAVASAQAKPIELALHVEALTAKGPARFIDSDEVLRSGDRLALHVDVSEPAYVYVGHRAANGTRSVIYPRSGSELVAPGLDHRIPAAGQWFKLDRDAGQEDLFLYASRQQLSSEEMAKLLETDSARWKVTEARPRPKPPVKAKPASKPGSTTSAPATEGVPPDLDQSRGLDLDTSGDIERGKDLTRAHFLIRHAK